MPNFKLTYYLPRTAKAERLVTFILVAIALCPRLRWRIRPRMVAGAEPKLRAAAEAGPEVGGRF